jgi:hypothetical protein
MLFARANGAEWCMDAVQAQVLLQLTSTLSTATFSDTADGPSLECSWLQEPTTIHLPVKLLYFTGTQTSGDVNLKWATASENNNAGFTHRTLG